MVSLNFKLLDGEVRKLDALEGESIMQAATRNGVPGIIGECGGEMSCATCHVHVDAEWRAKLRAPSQDERDLVEMSDDLTEDSRLACQIKVRPELDGMILSVLPSMV